ncbi:MAG: dinitrogenase iron-molybdenum cofactor biosynthesis protein [Candidatus Zixiibacteriota bacterium]|nr:MAG: dinitrogenase iron-molybdenum cofactor biosynthesis protein [candidate division Zixibacteria bacterium]
MRIAVSSQGTDLTSKVDPRFGRASYFLVFDTSDESFEVVENSQNVNAAQGAGIQAAETVANKKVDIVVAGNFGPKAFRAFEAAGIKTALWADGTVSEAIELVRNNKLKILDKANVGGHWM